jgi:hypothetical protein
VRRAALRLVAVAVAALAFGAAPAGAQLPAPLPSAAPLPSGCVEGEPLTRCPFHADSHYRLPMQARQIAALVEPKRGRRARRLYRALVPPQFAMPARRAVGLWFVDVAVPRAGAEALRWREASIALRVRHGGGDGWFQLSQPVDSQLFYDYGRGVGFAKYLAAFSLDGDGQGATGTATVGGRESVRVAFSPRPAPAPSAALRRWSLLEDPWLSLYSVFRGPRLLRVKYTPEPPTPLDALPEPTPGTVRYALDPDLDALDRESPEPLPELFPRGTSLRDLVPVRGRAPATWLEAPINLHVQIDDVASCGDCWPRRATMPR